MAKILVLYYSAYGHVETLAKAVAEGARSAGGVEVTIKRVPELMPEEVARKAEAKLDQVAPIAAVAELSDYDAIIFGTPARFGNMASQMRNFSSIRQAVCGQRAHSWARWAACLPPPERAGETRPRSLHSGTPWPITASSSSGSPMPQRS